MFGIASSILVGLIVAGFVIYLMEIMDIYRWP